MDENKKAWYDTEESRAYEEAVEKIKKAVVEDSAPFDEAASRVEVKDEKLRSAIASDALKVLIAEMHFLKKKSLEEVADALKLPLKRVAEARKEMVAEIEADAIQRYKDSLGQGGNA
ncbi:MAG: hypothetical protein P8Y85_10050 [Nitrospirota bacterium]|jgi:hypothetical protein